MKKLLTKLAFILTLVIVAMSYRLSFKMYLILLVVIYTLSLFRKERRSELY